MNPLRRSTETTHKPARILKTKFYPVSVDRRQIRNDPIRRERDLAWKYRATPGWIGLRGYLLLMHPCYGEYQWLPAQ